MVTFPFVADIMTWFPGGFSMVVVSGWKAGKEVGRLVVSCLCCIGDGWKVIREPGSRGAREPGRRMVGRVVLSAGLVQDTGLGAR